MTSAGAGLGGVALADGAGGVVAGSLVGPAADLSAMTAAQAGSISTASIPVVSAAEYSTLTGIQTAAAGGAGAGGGILGSGISASDAGLGVSAVGKGVEYYGQMKQQEAMQRQQQLQATRQKLATVRSARIAYANAQNNAANQGAIGSSSAAGGGASIVSQMNANTSFLDQYNTASGDASSGSMFAGIGSSAANLGFQIFANDAKVNSIFD